MGLAQAFECGLEDAVRTRPIAEICLQNSDGILGPRGLRVVGSERLASQLQGFAVDIDGRRKIARMTDRNSSWRFVRRVISFAMTSPPIVLTMTRSPRRMVAAGETMTTSPGRKAGRMLFPLISSA